MLIIGFFLLVVGANWLVKGSSNIAKRFNIPEIIIGLTIVAIGTSMPELIITITSAGKSSTDLIIGNAIGSNLCNLLFILSIISIINPIKIDKETKYVHIPVALFSSIVILFMGMGMLGSKRDEISKTDGIILVVFYLIYFLYPIIIEVKDIIKSMNEDSNDRKKKNNNKPSILISIIYIILGVIALKVGGDLVVDEASEIATIYGISERVIGLTVVAIGTALPELITSIVAVITKEENLATGNLIGSCILNSFLILGTGAIITPLNFSIEFIYNTLLLIFSILLIWLFSIRKKSSITRINGIILLTMYVIYMVNLF